MAFSLQPLMMKTACFSARLALTYKSTWCQSPRLQQQDLYNLDDDDDDDNNNNNFM
jgi:hypothetical protein